MANRIKELRKNNGLTLSDLSKATNIPISSINKYENMEREISEETAKRIASYFHVDVPYLLRQTKDDLNTVMVNLDDKAMIPFKSTNIEARYSAIAINQVLEWLDSDKMLLYADKRKKTSYSREHELELLKEMHATFEEMRDSIQEGMDRNIVPNEDDYIQNIDNYTTGLMILRKFVNLDTETQLSILQLVNKLYRLSRNKKVHGS